MTHEHAIRAHGLCKAYGEGRARVQALKDLDLEVPAGSFVAVMGASGSGKSTLLHLLGGLAPPDAGTLMVGGTDILALDDDALTLFRRRQVGFVFQDFNVLDILTAEENVALPLLIDGVAEREAHERARKALERVDLLPRAEHRPDALSGGEQQRVAVARALVGSPSLMLADEPTGNLDSHHTDEIMGILRRLADDEGQTILMVTHEARNAALADHLVVLEDGRIKEQRDLPRGRATADLLRDLGERP